MHFLVLLPPPVVHRLIHFSCSGGIFAPSSVMIRNTISKADFVNSCIYCKSSSLSSVLHTLHEAHIGRVERVLAFPGWHTETGCTYGTLGYFGLKPVPNGLNACCAVSTAL